MTRRITTTAAVAAAGAALAFGAYGIGSQVGDGDATAASNGGRSGSSATAAREHPGLAQLADELGVSTSKLRTALGELRSEDPEEDRHAEMAAALADALGKSTDEVTKALEELDSARHDAFAANLAKELGVDAARVASALEENKPEGRRRPSFGALAKDIGVTRAELRAAFRSVDRDGMGRHEDRGDRTADLAKALGVTEKQLEDASEKLEDTAEERHDARRAAFAKKLADKLGIDADKVEAALEDAGPFGDRGGHRGGPGGPGGHGGGPGGHGGRP